MKIKCLCFNENFPRVLILEIWKYLSLTYFINFAHNDQRLSLKTIHVKKSLYFIDGHLPDNFKILST